MKKYGIYVKSHSIEFRPTPVGIGTPQFKATEKYIENLEEDNKLDLRLIPSGTQIGTLEVQEDNKMGLTIDDKFLD